MKKGLIKNIVMGVAGVAITAFAATKLFKKDEEPVACIEGECVEVEDSDVESDEN